MLILSVVFGACEAQARVFFRPLFGRVVRTSQPTLVRTCSQFSCTSQPVQRFSYGSGSYGHGYKNNFVNNRFDPNGFEQVDQRFNALRAQKGVLFEAKDGEVVSQLFINPPVGEYGHDPRYAPGQLLSVGIDRFGNVRGFPRPVAVDRPVFAQLARFYFDNLGKFKKAVNDARISGNRNKFKKALDNLNLVNGFLGFAQKALGIRRGGGVNFDYSKMSVPAKYLEKGKPIRDEYTVRNLAVGALNYTLNMLTNRCENICAGRIPGNGNGTGGCENVAQFERGGVIGTVLNRFFDDRTIDYMTNAIEDPYACGNKATLRIDHFIAKVLGDPKVYYAIKFGSKGIVNFEDYAIDRGISFNSIKSAQARERKMVVGPEESIVAHRKGASRILGVQTANRVRNKFGGNANAYISYDYSNAAASSVVTGASNDLLRDPVGAIGAQAGGEGISEQCNGMQEYYVMDGKGNFVDEVPASIARGENAISGNGVSNPLSCIKCHQGGWRGASQHPYTHKNDKVAHNTEILDVLGPVEGAKARARGFGTLAEYRGISGGDNIQFFQALRASNAFISDPKFADIPAALPFDMVKEYYEDLDDEKVSREFGVNVTVAQLLTLRDSKGRKLFTQSGEKDGKPVIDRTQFEGGFCEAKAALLRVAGGDDNATAIRGQGSFSHSTGRPTIER